MVALRGFIEVGMEKYILLTTFAELTPEEAEFANRSGESPLAVVSVAREYLERWILCSDFRSLDEFLSTFTYDIVEVLAADAERAGFLAFYYRPNLDQHFKFPEFCRGDALEAFADFLSSLLNDNGYIDASKYLDALMEL